LPLIMGPLALHCSLAQADRQSEIDNCEPSELATWADGKDGPAKNRSLVFAYSGGGSSQFKDDQVRAMIKRAALAWEACGLEIRVGGEVESLFRLGSRRVIVKWADKSLAAVAHADLGRDLLLLNPQVFLQLQDLRGAEVATKSLQMTISHEMGHFLGMRAHSRRCVDVMSYYTSPTGEKCSLRDPSQFGRFVEYRHDLPTACDIARCRALNPPR